MSFNGIKPISMYVCLLFDMGLKHFGHLASPYYCFWNWCFRTHICSLAWLVVMMKVYEILLLLGRGTKLVSTYLEWNAQCTYLRMAAQHSTAVQWAKLFLRKSCMESYLKSDNLQYNTLGHWDERLIDQGSDVPSIIFFIISYRVRALKILYFYYKKIEMIFGKKK